MARDERNNYTIELEDNRGEIVIEEEAVAVIAGIAAMEVEGVAIMASNATKDLISKIGKKSLSKGVKVDILDDVATIAITLNIKYGYNIMDISAKVQEKVKVAVENMTGLTVADVNVRVVSVEVEA